MGVEQGKCRELTRSDDGDVNSVYIYIVYLQIFNHSIYRFDVSLVHFSVVRRSPAFPHMPSWSWLDILELVLENQVSLSLVTLTMCPIVTVIKEIYFDNMNYDKLKIRYYEHFQNQ